MVVKGYLGSGRCGDFIHSLAVCKYNYDMFGYSADIFITDYYENFEHGLANTYNDLDPILKKQSWINNFKIYNNQSVDYNLAEIRNSSLLYSTNWLTIYLNYFLPGVLVPRNYSWLEIDKENEWENSLLINRSNNIERQDNNIISKYESLIEQFDKAFFICTNIEQYAAFPLKEKVQLLKVDTLYDFFIKINSCKLFAGNQSGPMAWATSLNVPRVVELAVNEDRHHYETDWEIYSTIKYFN